LTSAFNALILNLLVETLALILQFDQKLNPSRRQQHCIYAVPYVEDGSPDQLSSGR
jgi:hypothetical protein